MTRRIVIIAALLCAGFAATAQPASPPRGVAVGVAQKEFTLQAYRKTVKPGLVRFNIENLGEDDHNLVVRGPKGFLESSPDVEPGGRYTFRLRLRRQGTYSLLCTKADHLSRGMKTRIKVRG